MIALAVLFPWLLLREPFDIALKISELNELTPTAQSLIELRQTTTLWFLNNVGFISGALVIIGVVLLGWGLYGWNKMQKLRDEREYYETEKVRRELEPMSPEQIAQKVVVDVIEDKDSEEIVSPEEETPLTDVLIPTSSVVHQYFRVEKMVQDKLRFCLRNDGEVLTNRRIKSAEYDVVLQTTKERLPDVIFEIKYASKGFKLNWVRESVNRLILATELYIGSTGRRAISIILYISPRATLNRISTETYRHRVIEETRKLDANPSIYFIAEEDWTSLECSKLYSMIFTEQTNE